MSKLEITLKKSPIGFEGSQGATARGMIFKIRHMLQVVEVAE